MTDASKGGLVFRVEPGSLAEYLQIRPGDRIVSINGRALRDEIDFRFYCAEENVTLEIVTGNGQEKSFEKVMPIKSS
ncbi:MAG TPA: PDZ domain-containing protein, partial [Firmicutes bacterium]|nr:PDZ domain-containing protein [Bacillota bacterium]